MNACTRPIFCLLPCESSWIRPGQIHAQAVGELRGAGADAGPPSAKVRERPEDLLAGHPFVERELARQVADAPMDADALAARVRGRTRAPSPRSAG